MRRSTTRTGLGRATLGLLILVPLAAWAEPQPASEPAPEPAVIKVGDVDGTFLKPVSQKWKITQTTSSGQTVEWGTATYEVELLDMDGRPVIKRTQVMTTRKGTTTDVAIADRKTFAPIVSEETKADSHILYEVKGDQVKVQRTGELHGDAASAELQLEMPAFDFNLGMYELVLAALPLREGYTARLPTLQYPQKFEWSTIKVTGKENVDAGGGKQVEAWMVELQIPGFREVVWLSKDPPYVLKQVFYGPRGGHQTIGPM